MATLEPDAHDGDDGKRDHQDNNHDHPLVVGGPPSYVNICAGPGGHWGGGYLPGLGARISRENGGSGVSCGEGVLGRAEFVIPCPDQRTIRRTGTAFCADPGREMDLVEQS